MPAYRWPWLALTSLYCFVIFLLSSQPDLGLDPPRWLDWPHSDKLVHFLMFGGLAGLVACGLSQSNPGSLPAKAIFGGAVLFATGYGLTDEIHQLYVPNRSFDPLDLLADAAGATIFAGGFAAWTARRPVSAVQPQQPQQG